MSCNPSLNAVPPQIQNKDYLLCTVHPAHALASHKLTPHEAIMNMWKYRRPWKMMLTYLSIVEQYLVPSLDINAREDEEVRPQSPAANGNYSVNALRTASL